MDELSMNWYKLFYAAEVRPTCWADNDTQFRLLNAVE